MQQPNTIAFIYCWTSEYQLADSLAYINNLIVPPNISFEIIKVQSSEGLAFAYNEADKLTNAKYKVYLHQDTNILNTNFIADVINIFQQDTQIGMIGVIGTKKLTPSSIWWYSSDLYGTVDDNTTGTRNTHRFTQPVELFEEVEAIDGLIMITQHNILWRSDLFDGWDFYDISHSFEMLRANFKVVIPKQQSIWCYHNSDGRRTNPNSYEKYRQVFINEYMH